MRIHSLTLCGIGPFPGEVSLDIDALGASGIFVITGPTGSGKTMLLDALMFGLYAKLSGEDADPQRLRSRHLDPDQSSSVQVVFTVPAGTYRVSRSPSYMRPKKRGNGFTESKADAVLERLADPGDSSGQPVASGPRQVGEELSRILPLTSEQFCQTVILPQGAFTRFLKAKSDDRAKILQQIFGTHLYARIEDILDERARQARARVSQAQAAVKDREDAAHAALAACGLDGDDDANRQAAPGWLERKRLEAAEAEDAASAAHEELSFTSSETRGLAGRAQQGAEAAIESARLEAVAEEIERARTDCRRDEAARRAVATWAEVDKIRACLESASAEVEDAALKLRSCDPDGIAELAAVCEAEEKPSPSSLSAADDAVGEALTSLAEGLRAEKELAERAQRCDQLERRGRELDASLAAYEEEIAGLPKKQRDAQIRHGIARAAAEQAEQLAQAIAEAEHRVEAATRWEELVERQKSIAEERQRAARECERAQADYDHLDRQWRAQAASELVATLTKDAPCPVCGSLVHPSPAPRHDGDVTLADLKLAAGRVERARADLERTKTDLCAVDDAIAKQACQLGNLMPREARVKLEDLNALRTEALKRARGETAAVGEIAALSEREQALTDLTRNAEEERERLDAERAGLKERMGELERVREGAKAHASSVEERMRGLEATRRDLRHLRDVIHEHTRTSGQADQALETARRSTGEAGFAGRDDAEAALLSEGARSSLLERIAAHEADQAKVAHTLSDPEIIHAMGRTLPHRTLLEGTLARARKRLTKERERRRDTDSLVLAAERSLAECDTARKHLDQVRAGERCLLRVDALVNARQDQANHTPLSTWVLLAALDEVLAAANAKLAQIARGRYELVRGTSDGSQKRNQALSIDVIDHEAPGEPIRRSATLSGGESFYCSLALALALAESVTQTAGGIDIGTMFIDEGFGTLDEETLSEVLRQLVTPARGERCVGVISHVPSVRDYVRERVVITRGDNGSRARAYC
ncbi:MAG: SMC family ATPase [Actinomycetaceae bacterium]|nr:SMC family ATPase [Actinomycetaceae bacterium]